MGRRMKSPARHILIMLIMYVDHFYSCVWKKQLITSLRVDLAVTSLRVDLAVTSLRVDLAVTYRLSELGVRISVHSDDRVPHEAPRPFPCVDVL